MPNAPQLTMSSFGTEMTDENTTHSVSGMLRTPGVRLDSGSGQDASFLDVEESDAESYRYSDDIPILQRNDEVYDKPAKMTGVTFDELVDRLLAPRMTKADANFAEVFLCLYRKFAAPSQLFSAILSRLDAAKNETGTPYLLKTTTQLRIIEAVARWVSAYPGDFARPATRRRLEELIQNLSTDPVFALAAAEMHMQVDQNVVEDDDTGWANSDETKHDSGHFTDILDDARCGSEISESLKSLRGQETRSSDFRPSLASDLATMELESGGHVARFEYHTLEDYEREAATMVPTATLPLNKIRYHIFMDLDADDVADEITRIDWVMFSSIRIRDFVRHVSLSLEEKERCKSLKNVNRMISHFNHVAKWVSNMILIRDKAKHRAPCLQKFMLIALKLRQLNNYNGLAAVLAGINGTAVHRLAQTRALVDQDVQKRFARLGLLMGTQKSHFAYRLAWENSPLPRIPFIPLHRRDLVSAEEGSRTFVGPQGDRINWKKFEVLGEVILPIMKSQGTAYPNLKRHNLSRELILDCRMPTDEEVCHLKRSQEASDSSNRQVH